MKYELTYIISSDENLQGSEVIVKWMEDFIVKEGGTIIAKENPSARNLAYPIKSKSSGFLSVVTFELETEKIKNLENAVKKEQKILRYTLLKKKHTHPPKPRREASYIPKISRRDIKDIPGGEKKEEEKKIELKDIEEQLEKILND